MLLKKADNHDSELSDLARAATELTGEVARQAQMELKRRKAGMKGESDAAYLIDFDYGESGKWVVIHDLRLEHNGRVAQIDHLMISRWMACYVLESKHFHAGIKITEEGEFLRWNDYKRTYEGMESPLEQNQPHISVLTAVMRTLDLPVRLGMRMTPKFHSLVLVSSKSRIDRPKTFDASRVIKADQLQTGVNKAFDKEGTLATFASISKIVGLETLRDLAEQLVKLHRPIKWPVPDWFKPTVSATDQKAKKVALAPVAAPITVPAATLKPADEPKPPQAALDGPQCKKCSGRGGQVLHGRYGYYFKCDDCATNTGINFVCLSGHTPRVRKSGSQFFRDCAQCGTAQLFFANE